MSGFERGPLLTFEVTWKSGHVETVRAHQCILPMPRSPYFDSSESDGPRRVMFHGEVDGRWQLLLAAPEAEIVTVRNLTAAEESL